MSQGLKDKLPHSAIVGILQGKLRSIAVGCGVAARGDEVVPYSIGSVSPTWGGE